MARLAAVPTGDLYAIAGVKSWLANLVECADFGRATTPHPIAALRPRSEPGKKYATITLNDYLPFRCSINILRQHRAPAIANPVKPPTPAPKASTITIQTASAIYESFNL
jgi:hypothetical protein